MQDPAVSKKLKDGDVVYAFTKNGNVFINPNLKTTKATLHEAGHIWMDFMKDSNPELFKKGLSLVEGTQELKDAIDQYGDTELAREEALMEIMSTKGDNIVNAAQKAKVKEWLLSVWKYVSEQFQSLRGLNPQQVEDLSLDKFVEGILADVLSGKEITGKKTKGKTKFSKEEAKSVSEFEKQIEEKYGISLDLLDYNNGNLQLSKIVVPKENRGQGIGEKAMNEIIEYADKVGRRITLTPSTDFGATSVNRLKDFYKQFGFVENTGKNKDFSTRESMYRNPIETKAETKFSKESANDNGANDFVKQSLDEGYTKEEISEILQEEYGKTEAEANELIEQNSPKTSEPNIFDDFDASNKRGGIRSQQEAKKAFTEKHGEDAAIAKAISTNFEAIADELKAKGIFKKINCK
jgi:GNAT superfamily N-acetyltransferase